MTIVVWCRHTGRRASASLASRHERQSLEQVLQTGRADSLPLVHYPIRLPKTRDGDFEIRYWSVAHTPLPGPDGQVAFVVQNTVDVTELHRLKQWVYGADPTPPEPGAADLLQRTREVEATNESLLQETRGLRDLFLQAPGFMAVLTGPEHRFALANAAYQKLIGHRPVIGRRAGNRRQCLHQWRRSRQAAAWRPGASRGRGRRGLRSLGQRRRQELKPGGSPSEGCRHLKTTFQQ